MCAALVLAVPTAEPSAAAEPPRIAVFDLELIDTSLAAELRGTDPADLARLRLIGDELRARLAASTEFAVVDTAPAADAVAAVGRLRGCKGCEADIAADLGADLAAIGWVQKVSNLILNINLQIRDVATGELRFAESVDIRGNTDESWLHGIRYILKYSLLEEQPTGADR